MRKLIAVLIVLAAGFTAVAVTARAPHRAKQTSGVIYVSITHAVGGFAYADGDFKDKLLGRGAIIYRVRVSPGNQPGSVLVKSPKVTIYTEQGSLTGTAQALQVTRGTGANQTVTVKNGTFNLKRGVGRFRGHTLRGTFGGDLKAGVYKFNYKGTYR
jgi:hypothetical protein